MAERQSPPSRGGGKRRPTGARDRDEYQQPASQSRSGPRQPSSQSRDGYRQPSSQGRDGYRQPSSQSRDGYRQPSSQGRDGYRQPSSQGRDGYRQPSSQSRSAPRQPAPAQSRSDDRGRRQSPPRRNDVIRCENCGEDYSVTYKRCPFCDERPSRGGISGKRVANTRGGGYGRPASALKTATWIGSFIVVIAALVIIYRFMGAPFFGGNKNPSGSQSPGSSSVDNSSASGGSSVNTPVTPAVESIALSQSELTLEPGQTNTLTASLLPAGAEGTVTWSSSNEAAATVDASGNVTNVNTGASGAQVTITASCGGVSAEATVYCKPSGTIPSGGQQGKIVNADKGVNIRSGPGTDYDKVASVGNGSTVTVLGEENGWYKVAYKTNQTGYIRKDFISIS